MSLRFRALVLAMAVGAVPAGGFALPANAGAVKVVAASWHDISPPLRELRKRLSPALQALREGRHLLEDSTKWRVIPIGRARAFPAPVVRDPAVQSRVPASGPAFDYVANFDGIGNTGAIPPDPDIAVGNDFVLAQVNVSLAVFDKQGETVMPPTPTNSLWQGFGGACETQNSGDGIVLYDRMAQRWIVSQFTIGDAPFYECVAVSVTDDPAGRYYRYAFKTGDADFPDYPKLGVWPDAYYASFNNFGAFGVAGVTLAAFDRAAMLAGEPAREMLFVLPKTQLGAFGLLPAELDGATRPPAGAPGYFLSYVSPTQSGIDYHALELWRMRVNWLDPAASSLSGPVEIRVPPFNDDVCGTRGFSGSCIPQPNGAPRLEALSDRLMYRLAYRNLGTHEAMVVNHTVSAGTNDQPPTGIRWYELADSAPGASDWSLAQSGTWAPADGASRWMGSLALDRAGDLMLGYSLSGPAMPPSIAFTGRLAGDPSGRMTLPEQIIQAGGGEQKSAFGRWGDYSAMAADPSDGCTQWYVNEYYPASGFFDWQTKIAGMRFSACSSSSLGTLTGTVTSAADGTPIAGAHVKIEPDRIVTTTDKGGQYRVELDPGDYTVSALAWPYLESEAVSVNVVGGAASSDDIALATAPLVTVSGRVCDGGRAAETRVWTCGDAPGNDVHGWGMHAKLTVLTPSFGEVAETWSDPATGAWRLHVAKGLAYTVRVAAGVGYFGYQPASAYLTAASPAKLNFALGFSPHDCGLPGYDEDSPDCSALPGGLVVGEVTDANTGAGEGSKVSDDLGNETAIYRNTPSDEEVKDPALKSIYTLFTSAGRRELTASTASGEEEVGAEAEVVADAAVRRDMAFGTADLAVAGIADTSLTQGASVPLEIKITNNGPDTSARAGLAITAAGSLVRMYSPATTQGSCSSTEQNGVDCSFGDLAPGASVTVTIHVLGVSVGSTEITASASEIDTDPDPGNSSAKTQVEVVTPPPQPNRGGSGGLGWPLLALMLGLVLARARQRNR